MDQMLQSEDIEYQNGFNKTKQLNKTASQDPSLGCLLETHFRPKTPADWKWGDGEVSSMLKDVKRKPE